MLNEDLRINFHAKVCFFLKKDFSNARIACTKRASKLSQFSPRNNPV